MNWSNDGEILPLKGDGQGRYRVRITGNSGVGKSTLAKKLSIALGYAPVLHMDEIFWQPGWATASTMEFNSKLQDFLRSNEGGSCIIDGNYRSEIDWGMKEMNDLTDVILKAVIEIGCLRVRPTTFSVLLGPVWKDLEKVTRIRSTLLGGMP
ncbi:hypothetical protein FRC02_009654 [Tulasnella sp. 418]|nr:hypothetical protein FRC02_009654 [Tulasnella sp. 418]